MAWLQITLDVSPENRAAAAGVYQQYKAQFLNTIDGATAKRGDRQKRGGKKGSKGFHDRILFSVRRYAK